MIVCFNAYPRTQTNQQTVYCGNADSFERVLDMVEDAAEGLLQHIRQRHQA